MGSNLQETADLVTLTEEVFNEKLQFLCSDTEQYSLGKKEGWGKSSTYKLSSPQ